MSVMFVSWSHCMMDAIGVESGGVSKNATVTVVGVVTGVGSGDSVCVVTAICGPVETVCPVVVWGVDFDMSVGSLGSGDSTSMVILV